MKRFLIAPAAILAFAAAGSAHAQLAGVTGAAGVQTPRLEARGVVGATVERAPRERETRRPSPGPESTVAPRALDTGMVTGAVAGQGGVDAGRASPAPQPLPDAPDQKPQSDTREPADPSPQR